MPAGRRVAGVGRVAASGVEATRGRLRTVAGRRATAPGPQRAAQPVQVGDSLTTSRRSRSGATCSASPQRVCPGWTTTVVVAGPRRRRYGRHRGGTEIATASASTATRPEEGQPAATGEPEAGTSGERRRDRARPGAAPTGSWSGSWCGRGWRCCSSEPPGAGGAVNGLRTCVRFEHLCDVYPIPARKRGSRATFSNRCLKQVFDWATVSPRSDSFRPPTRQPRRSQPRSPAMSPSSSRPAPRSRAPGRPGRARTGSPRASARCSRSSGTRSSGAATRRRCARSARRSA